MPLYTVFTPTFNRAHTLPRAYASLCGQTVTDFDWVIVDDGSSDETKRLVAGWIATAPFPIVYDWLPHRGKMSALNRGMEIARGERFVVLDSDDALLPGALETLDRAWRSIPQDRRERFSGVDGLSVDAAGRVVGDEFPSSPLDIGFADLKFRLGVSGEKCGFTLTELVRGQRFPDLEGVEYMPEGVLWYRIERGYLRRCINEPVRIYYADAGARVMAPLSPATHARGHALWHGLALDEIIPFRHAPREFLRSAVHYVRFSLHAGTKPAIAGRFRNRRARLAVLVCFPAGVALFLFDKLRTRRLRSIRS